MTTPPESNPNAETESASSPETKSPSLLKKIRDAVINNLAVSLGGLIAGAALSGAGAMLTALVWYWHTYVDIPPGVVVASLVECRDIRGGGWKTLEAAGGRVIIGAGQHSNPNVKKIYDVFATEGKSPPNGFEKSTGGEEAHKLTIDEMPRHDHTPDSAFVNLSEITGTSTEKEVDNDGPEQPNLDHVRRIQPQGGDAPHPIIPPYIALYYCQKT